MNTASRKKEGQGYLSALGAWALAFGCAVGWGSFVMPGNTFLPLAGPVGSAVGLALGAMVMLLIGANYHFLMNRCPDNGGTYSYTKQAFGYDQGFLSAWFLILTYIAIIWANASALPLIARTLLGSTFQFGFHYEIAGFHVWFGEILLAVGSLAIGAWVCLRRRLSVGIQILMALLLLGGVVVCYVAARARGLVQAPFQPAFAPDHSAVGGTITVFALAPWAFVGFESISHSAGDARFPLKRSFLVMAVALGTAAVAYALLSLMAVTALPEGCASWTDYIARLGDFSGVSSQPTFFAAHAALGDAGSVLLGLAALGGIVTGLIGHYIALSRLIARLAEDGLMPGWLGRMDARQVPRNAILSVFAVSVIFPFLGRTAISWIVDVTTVGATIAYTFASASALRTAREEKNTLFTVVGLAGLAVSLLFALEFLIPNILSISTLSTESYLILAAWGILGLMMFRLLLKKDAKKRLGRSTTAWVVLLGLIIFTSSVWLSQSADRAVEKAMTSIQSDYNALMAEAGAESMISGDELSQPLQTIDNTLTSHIFIQIALIVIALIILFDIYSQTQKRERQTEIEKALAEDASRAKSNFLSNMSHEIRTPMNAIIGLDSIALRNPNLAPQTRDQLEKIGASARHLLGLINDILDMSRIESGRMVLKDEEFSLREFLDQVNIIINGQCVEKGLHYECSIIGSVADYYYGDDMKLKQVLINILGNSVKFTDAPGDVTLTVEQIGGSDADCALRFSMKDNGIGMDAEYIPRIFEAFSQEDATTTNRYGGSGLGMAITKNFVEMMGGTIHVDSKKNVGSTFTVTVPMKRSDRAFRVEDGLALPEGLRAAVVDDDTISCEHIQLVLKAIGIESDTFTDPKAALSQIRAAHEAGRSYGLVMTDYKMPAMNGLDVVRAIRAFDGGETAIIMLTGYNWDIIEDEAMQNGVDSIVAKPLFPDSLTREIHGVLAKKAGVPMPLTAAAEEAPEALEGSLAGRRVLMVEDVIQNAEILEDILDLEDILAEHAENGQRALEMFRDHPAGYYDAILMDVRMPVMDGLTATKAIRALDRPDARTIPIIAMTANVFDEDVERSREAGMNGHLGKPVEPEILYATLARLLRGKEAQP